MDLRFSKYHGRLADECAIDSIADVRPKPAEASRFGAGSAIPKPTKCLIIAAGKGSRLCGRGDSKPLVPLLGMALVERVILTAKRAGLTDFYVVTGYNGEKLSGFLDRLAQSENISIRRIINKRWERGNGLSVLKAKPLLKESFFILMGDHIFDHLILSQMGQQNLNGHDIILAVDYRTTSNHLIDEADATKVLVEDQQIIDIGKEIASYNAYDTGIFLCTPAIFEAIEESIALYGDDTLSGGVKVLAAKRAARAFDIKDRFWVDVDSEDAYRKAENRLIGDMGKDSDGPVSRLFNRPLSTLVTKAIVGTGITPNQISLASLVLATMAAAIFVLPGYISLLVGGIVAQLSSIIDGCDGEVARLKLRESVFGGWFDAVLDRYADAFLLFGMTLHSFAASGNVSHLVIGFMAIIGSFVNSYTADKYDGLMAEEFRKGRRLRIGRDVRIFLISLGAIAGQPLATLALIAALMNAENIRRMVVCYRSEQVNPH